MPNHELVKYILISVLDIIHNVFQSLGLNGIIGVPNVWPLVLIQSGHELWKSKHLTEVLLFSLYTNPDFFVWHFGKLLVHLTREFINGFQMVRLGK